MSRYNIKKATSRGRKSYIETEQVPTGVTFEGAPGYARTAKSELFLLAVSYMGDDTFYEGALERESRFQELVTKVAAGDPKWIAGFTRWLRNDANMRTASVITAAEAARELLENGIPGGRQLISSALLRADEPGELLAYWTANHGRDLPMPVKRGVADAAVRLYNEYSLLKYDTPSKGYRFADVIDLTHPSPGSALQSALFRHALDRRHNHDEIDRKLSLIRANAKLRKAAAKDPNVLLDSEALKAAGFTWEDALSLAGTRLRKKDLWKAMIPNMGLMALTRNLRNFDDANISDVVADVVAAQLQDPEVVRRSRQFPFRFLAAYRAASSLRWSWPLEQALTHSVSNIPELPGRTLILVDRSGSMLWSHALRTDLTYADTASLFGSALALRCENANLVQFGTGSQEVPFKTGESILKILGRFHDMGGTNTAQAVRQNYNSHDRVVILTDEQTFGGYRGAEPTRVVPAQIPVYNWNLAGYRLSHGPSGDDNRHTFGGLTDNAFKTIPYLEAGKKASWPWES